MTDRIRVLYVLSAFAFAVGEQPNQSAPVMVMLGADWCEVCQQNKPALAATRKQYLHVRYVDIDTKQGKDLVEQLNVATVPTTVVMRTGPNGQLLVLGRRVGKLTAQEMAALAKRHGMKRRPPKARSSDHVRDLGSSVPGDSGIYLPTSFSLLRPGAPGTAGRASNRVGCPSDRLSTPVRGRVRNGVFVVESGVQYLRPAGFSDRGRCCTTVDRTRNGTKGRGLGCLDQLHATEGTPVAD